MSEQRFNHPGADGSMDLGFGPDPVRAQEQHTSTTPGTVTLSQEQFDALLARLGPQPNEFDYATEIAGVQQPDPDQQQQLVDLSQLNPTSPDFLPQLQQILNSAGAQVVQQSRQVAAQEQDRSSVLDTAWASMQERYADVAEHPEIVQMAAQREMDELRARGIDPMVVLANNMDAAVDRIAARAGATISKIRGLSDGDIDEPGDPQLLDAGNPGPRRPVNQGRGAASTNFTTELTKIQQEMWGPTGLR